MVKENLTAICIFLPTVGIIPQNENLGRNMLEVCRKVIQLKNLITDYHPLMVGQVIQKPGCS